MERRAELAARGAALTELASVIQTLRALAGVRLREAERALPGTRNYAQTVGAALAEVLALYEKQGTAVERPGRAAVVVFASEHGFVGALNRGLVEAAAKTFAAGADLFVVGRRGLSVAAEVGVPVRWSGAMTSQATGVPSLARRLAEELHERFSRGDLTAIDMLFACQSGLGHHTLARQSLLPLDRTAFPPPTEPPLIQLTPQRLAERLSEEYWFAELARAAMEALTAENAARVVALTAARDNIDRRLEDLRRREQSLRQEEITTELLDVVSGSEAVLSSIS